MSKIIKLIFLTFIIFTKTSALPDSKATILYFHDAHEISPKKDRLGARGGVARVKSIVDKVKNENPEAIIVFGGDLAGGSLFGAVYHGFPLVEAFNLIQVDLANFGQHDFDFGVEVTRNLIKASEFQWITSNLVNSSGESFAQLPTYRILNRSGISLGFIGLTDAMNTTSVDKKVLQKDLLKSAEKAVRDLENEQVDIVVAITQTGQDTNERLLEGIPEIDAIFSEEIYENRTNVFYVGDRPIITTCGNLGSIAELTVNREDNKTNLFVRVYPVDSTVEEDLELGKLQRKFQSKLEKDLDETISILQIPLEAGINTDFKCRWGETNVGNLITDSYRNLYDADIAFLNGGGIRANAPAGEFSIKDALAIIPFGNRICLVEISGRYIWSILEYGVGSVENSSGRFLQISGANYGYDWGGKKGNRLQFVNVGGNPLEMDKVYKLALPDYLLLGGDGFEISDNCKIIVPPASALIDVEVFMEYCKNKKVLEPTLENRITVKNRD